MISIRLPIAAEVDEAIRTTVTGAAGWARIYAEQLFELRDAEYPGWAVCDVRIEDDAVVADLAYPIPGGSA